MAGVLEVYLRIRDSAFCRLKFITHLPGMNQLSQLINAALGTASLRRNFPVTSANNFTTRLNCNFSRQSSLSSILWEYQLLGHHHDVLPVHSVSAPVRDASLHYILRLCEDGSPSVGHAGARKRGGHQGRQHFKKQEKGTLLAFMYSTFVRSLGLSFLGFLYFFFLISKAR